MNAGGTALESSGKVVPSGTIVGDTDTQTLTNKTLTEPILTLEQGPSVAPTAEGRITWDTDDDVLRIGNGATTSTIWPTTSIPSTDTSVVHLSGTETITGSKTFSAAPTISSIINSGTLTLPTSTDTLVGRDTTDVLTNKTLGSSTLLGANLDANSFKIVGLTDPTQAQDAATKAYVDAVISSLDLKKSVRVATTANITLSGTQTIDGVSLLVGDRVLVKDQTTGSENGIYDVASGAWSRSADSDNSPSGGEVTSGMFTFVEEGTLNGDNGWVLTTNNPIILDTTSLTFTQFSGAGQVIAGDGLTKTGNELDVLGTANRISVFADNVDIASTYVGQSSITTLGIITTGTWNGSTVGISYGGTNATTFASNEIIRMNSGGTALESTGKVAPLGDIVGTTDTQSLTNKTITDTGSTTRADRIATTGSSVVISSTAPTAGQILVASSSSAASWVNQETSGHVIQDEGTNVTQRGHLNFVGVDVTVTDDFINDATVVSITGGGGSGHTIKDESTALPQRTYLQFTGSEVTVTDDNGADTTIVEIPSTNDITSDDDLITVDIRDGFEEEVTMEYVGTIPTVAVEDYFVATGGQTVFTLSATPVSNTMFFAFVNGLAKAVGGSRDYTISGTTITFTSGLTVSDKVLFKYLS